MNVWDLLLNSKDSKEEEDEEDIKRTCIWLKEAGFPQYVQMFNDGEFPISLKLVQEDHYDFDGGSLMALFRRIEILNKSAEIKSESRIEEFSSTVRETVTIVNKPTYEVIEDDDSNSSEADEDDECDDKENVLDQTALSSNWSYEPRTRRWSHIESAKPQNDITDLSSFSLQKYLGFSLPKQYNYKTNEKSKRSSTLSPDHHHHHHHHHQIFDPIPEVCDSDLAVNNRSKTMTLTDEGKDIAFSTSLTSESKDSPDRLSPPHLDSSIRDSKSSHILRSTSLKLMKAVSRLSPSQMSFRHNKRGKNDPLDLRQSPVSSVQQSHVKPDIERTDRDLIRKLKELSLHSTTLSDKPNKLSNESFHVGDSGWINTRTGSFISRSGNQFDEYSKKCSTNVIGDLDPIIRLLKSDVDILDQMRSKIKVRSSSGSAPNSPVLRKKPNNLLDLDKTDQRLSDIESYTHTKSKLNANFNDQNTRISLPTTSNQTQDYDSSKNLSISPKLNRNSATRRSHTIYHNGLDKTPKLYRLIEFSVTQVNILKKLSVLGCTSMLEKYCPSQKNVFNWRLPRLLPQKQKISIEESARVFGTNLCICQIRFGQPYPPAILNVFQYLREQGPSVEGLFRKSGVKARSKALRKEIDENPNFSNFDEYGVFDIADVLKGFFRDLPDRLLTGKLSATLMAIYSYVPKEHQLEGLQLALLSLPDENRTALQILIEFLSFLSSHSEVTKMNATNLSLVFSPNLFNLPTDTSPNSNIGALRMKKTNGPNVKQLAEQSAAHSCTMDMITNVQSIFQVTDETLKKNHNKMNNSEPRDITQLLSKGLWQEWLCEKFSQLKTDTVNHKSGWTNISKDYIRKLHGANSLIEQLSYRKIGSRDNNADGVALRTWKVVIDIDVSPGYLFANIKDKRDNWDPCMTTTEVLQEVNDYVDLLRMTSCNADGSSIPRCFNLLRGHQLGMGGSSHIIVAESVNVEHLMSWSNTDSTMSLDSALYPADQSMVTGQIFCDNFMIEATSTKTTRVTWISRVDLRGHHSDWYSYHWGHGLVKRASGLKTFSESSFSQQSSITSSNTPPCDVIFCPAIDEPQSPVPIVSNNVIVIDGLSSPRETVL